jgi:hypothetical protein
LKTKNRLPEFAKNGNRTARRAWCNKKLSENEGSPLPLFANSGNRFRGETWRRGERGSNIRRRGRNEKGS